MQPEIQLANSSTQLESAQNKVLRNTYMMLGLTMIPTVIGAYMGLSLNFAFMAQHPVLSMIGMLAVMFGMFMGISANRNNALGVVLLLGVTFFFGLMLGPILQAALHFRNGAQLIGMAAGGTGAIFFTLATIATVTKKDFSFMGKFLMVGLVMLILASLANAYFQIPAASLAISAIAIMIFAGYLLYDVSQVVRGGETNYVMATLAIYLDIYNIFVNLLNLLMALAGNRD
ncbi:Bax inhibitor-1 family protein [Sulfuriferula thiophila]|uniref:Bax inhibitor-1 family protein n=1 Tax=Sulfuriferula thiophila TaxID=1781211 RepID=UPI000F61185A|nr:Bax inhibitor-1 family protein [Sulfuriferula thiophila]